MLKTALIFQSGMVLQREKPVPIWGKQKQEKKYAYLYREDLWMHVQMQTVNGMQNCRRWKFHDQKHWRSRQERKI